MRGKEQGLNSLPPTRGEGQGQTGAAETQLAALIAALTEIRDLEPSSFAYPDDWSAQIAACQDCKDYAAHPLMRGICDTHRRPIYERANHDDREEKRIGWRAKSIAREALSAQPHPPGGHSHEG